VKVNICQNCGLTMSGGVQACRRCKHKTLSQHDILTGDTYVLDKRITQLSLGADRSPRRSSQFTSAVVVLAVSGLGIMGYDCYAHPDGPIAKQAKAVISMLPSHGSETIARSKSGNAL
jgi:hypothetical protein